MSHPWARENRIKSRNEKATIKSTKNQTRKVNHSARTVNPSIEQAIMPTDSFEVMFRKEKAKCNPLVFDGGTTSYKGFIIAPSSSIRGVQYWREHVYTDICHVYNYVRGFLWASPHLTPVMSWYF